MNEETNSLNDMKNAYAVRNNELKSKFKTMLFTYRNALNMLFALKNELDEVVNYIDHLEIETIITFYKPILEKANHLVSNIELLSYEIKNHNDIKEYLTTIKIQLKSHNIDTWIKKFEELKYESREVKAKEEVIPFVTFNGLMWTKETKTMNWHEAMEYAKNLQLGGYSDWRLPTKEEFQNVIENCGGIFVKYDGDDWDKNTIEKNRNNSQYHNCIKSKGFFLSWYWCNKEYYSSTAWGVRFHSGSDFWSNKSNNYYTLCVRVQ